MILKNKYLRKKIVILGLGKTGFSCINFFLNQNIIPIVMDTRLSFPYKNFSILKKVKLYLGKFNTKILNNTDIIVVSPSISLNIPCLIHAAKIGIEIISDIEIFCRETNVPIIAITGSNGKTTVTKILENILKNYNLPIGVGGNIGIPVLNLLNNVSKKKIFLLELSSFQLESTYNLKPLVSTILNISEDHMDRYPYGIKQYRAAKLRIHKYSEKCLINQDDKLTFPININKKNYISFGEKNAQYQLKYQNNSFWLQKGKTNILNTNKLKLVGKHNYLNSLAALALADIIGVPHNIILETIMKFQCLPHRFQLIHTNNGVSWINDSKSTNIGSTISAIKSISSKGNIWLLLGGEGKSTNFNLLTPYLKLNNLKIYCFGKEKKTLYNLRPEVSIIKNNMKEAIKEISLQVQYGDTVLLSPSCASYDQFKDFRERGNFFTYLAKEFG